MCQSFNLLKFASRVTAVFLFVGLLLLNVSFAQPQPTHSFLVQAADLETAVTAVEAVGGTVTHQLGLINGVGAELTDAQQTMLAQTEGIQLVANQSLTTAGSKGPYSGYPTVIGANLLHEQGITGKNITVAVIDSGYWAQSALNKNTSGQRRVLAAYDAINDSFDQANTLDSTDDYGHGTHVSSIILNSRMVGGQYNGVAPDANLVTIKAFDPALVDALLLGCRDAFELPLAANIGLKGCKYGQHPEEGPACGA